MKKSIVIACSLAALTLAGAGRAAAQQSGLAGMHEQRVVQGRMCFTGHTHVGTGSPAPSKKQAIASAAQDWSSFTAFEYGSSWASWRASIAKQEKCQPSGANWACEVHARPCFAGAGRRARQARR